MGQRNKALEYVNYVNERAIRDPQWFWGDSPDANEAREFLYNLRGGVDLINEIFDNTPPEIQKTISYKKLPTNIGGAGQKKMNKSITDATDAAAPVVAGALAAPVMAGAAVEAGLAGTVGGLAGSFIGSKVGGRVGREVGDSLLEGDNRSYNYVNDEGVPTVVGSWGQTGEDVGGVVGSVVGGLGGSAAAERVPGWGKSIGKKTRGLFRRRFPQKGDSIPEFTDIEVHTPTWITRTKFERNGPWGTKSGRIRRGEFKELIIPSERGVVPYKGGEVVPYKGGEVVPYKGGEVVPYKGGEVVPYKGGEVVPYKGGEVVPYKGGEVVPYKGGQVGPYKGGQLGPYKGGEVPEPDWISYPNTGGQVGPYKRGEFLPATRGEFLPSTRGEFLPSTRGEFLPSTRGEFLPSTRGEFLPATRGEFLPATRGELVPYEGGQLPPYKGGPFSYGKPSMWNTRSGEYVPFGYFKVPGKDAEGADNPTVMPDFRYKSYTPVEPPAEAPIPTRPAQPTRPTMGRIPEMETPTDELNIPENGISVGGPIDDPSIRDLRNRNRNMRSGARGVEDNLETENNERADARAFTREENSSRRQQIREKRSKIRDLRSTRRSMLDNGRDMESRGVNTDYRDKADDVTREIRRIRGRR